MGTFRLMQSGEQLGSMEDRHFAKLVNVDLGTDIPTNDGALNFTIYNSSDTLVKCRFVPYVDENRSELHIWGYGGTSYATADGNSGIWNSIAFEISKYEKLKIEIHPGITNLNGVYFFNYSNMYSAIKGRRSVELIYPSSIRSVDIGSFIEALPDNSKVDLPSGLEYLGILEHIDLSGIELNVPRTLMGLRIRNTNVQALPKNWYKNGHLSNLDGRFILGHNGNSEKIQIVEPAAQCLTLFETPNIEKAQVTDIDFLSAPLLSTMMSSYNGVFDGFRNLRWINLPKNLKRVYGTLFYNCSTNLYSDEMLTIKLPRGFLGFYEVIRGNTSIGCLGCNLGGGRGTLNVYIPNTVESIFEPLIGGEYTFAQVNLFIEANSAGNNWAFGWNDIPAQDLNIYWGYKFPTNY